MAPDRPRRSVLIVANTAEEKGLLGAESFAHAPTVPIERMVAAIDLDMPIVCSTTSRTSSPDGATHSTLKGVFQKTAAAMGLTLSPDPMPEQAVFVRSDHYTMVKQGVPAVMLATGMANGGDRGVGDVSLDPLPSALGRSLAAHRVECRRQVRGVQLSRRKGSRRRRRSPTVGTLNDYFGDLFAPKAVKAQN